MHDLMGRIAPPEPLGSPLFRAVDLHYCYPDGTRALRGINLEISAGERIALVGPNGSGKTSLARQLCGLDLPTSGSLSFRGAALQGEHLAAERLKIGLLFQDPDDQLFGATLIDDVAFGPRNQGLASEPAAERARAALHQIGLAALAGRPPHRLSFGQKKRAALAGLLALRPEVLILDEPTANLDPRQEEVFLELLGGYAGTLICISHDLLFLYELCRRAVVLDRGRIHHDFGIRDLVSQREALREHGLDFSFRFSTAVVPEVGRDPEPSAPNNANSSVPPATALIDFRNYQFSYSDRTPALRCIDLTLREGERVALVGENGAGKSTLLACLLGLQVGEGVYRFAGERLTRRGRGRLWQQVGVVFQNCADQLFCPSVFEEVAFGLEQRGTPRREVTRLVNAALEQARLGEFAERVPLHLSGGERKRLALACALVTQPRLLILDEPTAGLDPQGEELLIEILRGINCGLLLVSHDLHVVGELTRRTLVMHQGALVEDLPTHDFLQHPGLASLNGLAFSYRQRVTCAIRELQHLHEHEHRHRHLHEHPHRHGELVHCHPHEHEHVHRHQYVHVHTDSDGNHSHPTRLLHDHDHADHADESHDHGHEPE